MKDIPDNSDKNNNKLPRLLISIDPGRSKSGMAIMQGTKEIVERRIIPTEQLPEELSSCISRYKPDIILMGDGTFSKNIRPAVKAAAGAIPLITVNEKHSTERARLKYFEENPPGGIWKLIPITLQVPREPVDDYAAVVMACDYLDQLQSAKG